MAQQQLLCSWQLLAEVAERERERERQRQQLAEAARTSLAHTPEKRGNVLVSLSGCFAVVILVHCRPAHPVVKSVVKSVVKLVPKCREVSG